MGRAGTGLDRLAPMWRWRSGRRMLSCRGSSCMGPQLPRPVRRDLELRVVVTLLAGASGTLPARPLQLEPAPSPVLEEPE